MTTPTDPLEIHCPACAALPGEACADLRTREKTETHEVRVHALTLQEWG